MNVRHRSELSVCADDAKVEKGVVPQDAMGTQLRLAVSLRRMIM